MNMPKKLKAILLLISISSGLAGCAASNSGKGVLPSGGKSMSEIYNHQMTYGFGYANHLTAVRSHLPKSDYSNQSHYTTIKGLNVLGYGNVVQNNSPKMLPNPTIVIYVYPHFDGNDQDYIPSHTAYVTLYKQTHFALPGEEAQ